MVVERYPITEERSARIGTETLVVRTVKELGIEFVMFLRPVAIQ